MRDPFVAAVLTSWRWWKERQLDTRWGGAVPHAIVLGIEVYDAALRTVQSHDLRREQERRDREAERRASDPRLLHRRR